MLWMRACTWPWFQPLILPSVGRALFITLEGAELIWPTVKPTLWLPKDWIMAADTLGNFATSTAVTWKERKIIGNSSSYRETDWRTDRVMLNDHLWICFCTKVVHACQNGLDVNVFKMNKHGGWSSTQKLSWQSIKKQQQHFNNLYKNIYSYISFDTWGVGITRLNETIEQLVVSVLYLI